MAYKLLLHEDVQVSSYVRFLNWLIDTLAIYLLLFLFGLAISLLTYLEIYEPYFWLESLSDGGYQLLGITAFFLYYFVTEVTTQRTLGKVLTGTIVLNEEGDKPKFKTILGRSACRLIGFEALSFIGGRRGWHDSASNTYVVKAKKWKELKELEESFNEIGNPEYTTAETKVMY